MNKLTKVLLTVFVIAAALLATVTLTIDGMVKSAIERDGSELMQTEVSIEDLDLSVFGGSGEIEGFVIKNPEGFSDNEAVRFNQIKMKVNLGSLFSDRVIVEFLEMNESTLFFEQKGTGTNLNTLKNNMDITDTDETQKSVVIDYLAVNNATIKVSTDIERERNAEASIGQIVLEDVGADGSNTLKETVRQVMIPILEKAIAKAVKSGVMEQLENKVKDLFQKQ